MLGEYCNKFHHFLSSPVSNFVYCISTRRKSAQAQFKLTTLLWWVTWCNGSGWLRFDHDSTSETTRLCDISGPQSPKVCPCQSYHSTMNAVQSCIEYCSYPCYITPLVITFHLREPYSNTASFPREFYGSKLMTREQGRLHGTHIRMIGISPMFTFSRNEGRRWIFIRMNPAWLDRAEQINIAFMILFESMLLCQGMWSLTRMSLWSQQTRISRPQSCSEAIRTQFPSPYSIPTMTSPIATTPTAMAPTKAIASGMQRQDRLSMRRSLCNPNHDRNKRQEPTKGPREFNNQWEKVSLLVGTDEAKNKLVNAMTCDLLNDLPDSLRLMLPNSGASRKQSIHRMKWFLHLLQTLLWMKMKWVCNITFKRFELRVVAMMSQLYRWSRLKLWFPSTWVLRLPC